MPRKAAKSTRPSRRTRNVWLCFLASMGAVTGLLALGDRSAFPGFQAVRTARLEPIPAARGVSAPTGARGVSVTSTGAQRDPILRIDRPLDRSRWRSIVIHDSGEPAGDAESIRRLHLSHGYRMMGYHFLIGNGNGLGDGVVHVGERWIRQVPGWHAVGPDAQWHNNHSIAICLVGNGDRRPMTGRQITQLVSLISRLQRELDIPAGAVHLHRDIARGLTTSPGAFFAADELEQGLLATVR